MLIAHATDRFVDLVLEGFDIAVRSHFAPLPNSSLVQRRVAVEPAFLVAAPAYVARMPALLAPQDLAGHDGLRTDPSAHLWRPCNAVGEQVDAAPNPRLVADEPRMLLSAARGLASHACRCRSAAATSIAARWSASCQNGPPARSPPRS